MKILTVRQPWAAAIIHQGKDVENRVRNVAGSYRGLVAIHAGLSYDEDALIWSGLQYFAVDEDGSHREPRGAIIGLVDLVDVHPGWIEGTPCSPWGDQYVEGAGQHHLVLAKPCALKTPIPYKGALGLRTLPDDIAARILAGVAS